MVTTRDVIITNPLESYVLVTPEPWERRFVSGVIHAVCPGCGTVTLHEYCSTCNRMTREHAKLIGLKVPPI